MLQLRITTSFKKDLKSCRKRRYNIDALCRVVNILRIPDILPSQYVDHMLKGEYMGYRECHIEPDWLLIYRQKDEELVLYRTGTHADLFKM